MHRGRALALDDDPFRQRIDLDYQVAAPPRRVQVADRGRAALAIACRRLVIADAVLPRAVKVVVVRETERHRCLDKSFGNRVLFDIADRERPARAG